MTEQHTGRPAGRLVFDDEAFRKLVDPKGRCDDADLAARLGVHRTTYARLKSGEFEPGEVVMRALLSRWPKIDPRRIIRYEAEQSRSAA